MAKAKKTGKSAPGKKAGAKKAAAKKAGNGKAGKTTAANGKAGKKKEAQVDLEALRKPVDEAKANLDQAKAEAKELTDKAQALVKEAKDDYCSALVPYREACRKAGTPCEFEGGRSANVSEKVSFLVEKVDDGVRVMVKEKPETNEVIPFDVLKKSVNLASYSYVNRWIGPKEKVGNKGGSLGNRLRAVLR